MPPDRLRHAGRVPTGGDLGRQAGLVGPGADRLGEVDVRVGVRGHGPCHRRQCTHQVLDVDDAERRQIGGLNSHTTSRPPGRVTRRISRSARIGVDDVAQPERDRHRVEGVVGEREGGRVARGEGEVGTASCRPAACRPRSRTGPRSHRRRGTAGTRSRYRRRGPAPALPGSASTGVDHLVAPAPVLPQGQHVVGEVVTAGDIVEHRLHLGGLLLEVGARHAHTLCTVRLTR